MRNVMDSMCIFLNSKLKWLNKYLFIFISLENSFFIIFNYHSFEAIRNKWIE